MPSASTVSEMQVVVSADTSKAESGLSSLGKSIQQGFGLAAGMKVFDVAFDTITKAVSGAGDLEQAVANISTIKPEIDTSAVFAALNDMSTRIPQTADQLGASLYNVFSSLDVSSEQGLALVEKFAQGAVGAGTSAETFGTAAMGVMNAYGLSVADADHVSDVFFATVNKGVITGQELASSLGPVTQSAKSAGVGLDELGAMIAAVTKEGGPAAQNVNNLNNFLQKVTTKEAQTQLNALGVATKTATGEFRPTTDVLTDLKAKLAGMTESARANALQDIFPDAQARIGAQTLLSQLDLVKSATEENRTSSGAAAAAYATMSATFNSQSTLLMNGLMAILTTVGAMLLPMITPLITAFATSLPGAFAAAQAAIGPVAEQIAAVLVPAFQALMAALPTISALLEGLFAIFSGTASSGVIQAVGDLMDQIFGPAASALILDFVGLAGDAVRGFTAAIVETFGMVVTWVQANWPLIQQTIQTVLLAIAAFWEAHGATIAQVVQAAWTIIKTTIQGALDIILSAITIAMQLINGDWAGAWETFVGLAERTLERLGTIIGAAFDSWVAIIDDATGGMLTKIGTWISDTTTAISDGWTAITTGVSSAWDGITTAITGAIDGIASALTSGWDGFKSTIQSALDAIQAAVQATWQAIPADIRADLVLIASALSEHWANFLTTISTALTGIQTAVSTAWTAISTSIATILASIGTAISTAWTGITTSVTTESTAVSTAITTAWTAVQTTTATIWGALVSAISEPLGRVVTAVQGMGESILSTLRGLVGSVTGAASAIGSAIVEGIRAAVMAGANALADAAASIVRRALQAAKAAVGAGGGNDGERAVGGSVRAGGSYLVGERGPELFTPGASGYITPNSQLSAPAMAMAGGGGGGMQTFRFDIAVNGKVSKQMVIEGYDLAVREGWTPGGLTG